MDTMELAWKTHTMSDEELSKNQKELLDKFLIEYKVPGDLLLIFSSIVSETMMRRCNNELLKITKDSGA